jgi:hypothetical protein
MKPIVGCVERDEIRAALRGRFFSLSLLLAALPGSHLLGTYWAPGTVKAEHRMQFETVRRFARHAIPGFEKADAGDRHAPTNLGRRPARLSARADQGSARVPHELPMLITCAARAAAGRELGHELALRLRVENDQEDVAVRLQGHFNQSRLNAERRAFGAGSTRALRGEPRRGRQTTKRGNACLSRPFADQVRAAV